jgi:hypothetical protein
VNLRVEAVRGVSDDANLVAATPSASEARLAVLASESEENESFPGSVIAARRTRKT